MTRRKLLIVLATGKQGGAAIHSLQDASSEFDILALTRNPSSAAAQALGRKPNVTIVEGDPTDPAPIFDAHGPIYGVYSITFVAKPGDEEKQSCQLIAEAIKNNVEHFVLSSIDRGGPNSDDHPTPVPHFASKYRIEKHLKDQIAAKGSNMSWTILRPTAFMDNLTRSFGGKAFISLWSTVGEKPIQVVSSHDIGMFAARAFLYPTQYHNRAVSIAGDELTAEQAKKVFMDTMGYPVPTTFAFVGIGIKFMMKDMGTMFDWFRTHGFAADIPALREEEPRLQSFSMWLKETSPFKPL